MIFFTHIKSIKIPKTEYVLLDNIPPVNSNNLSILNFNIRLIPKNIKYFRDNIIHSISTKTNIIGLTEIRLDSHLASLYEFPGYHMYSNCRNVHGGGVALYVDRDCDSSMISDLVITEKFIESLGVEVTISTKKYLFLCIYRPPSGSFNGFQEKNYRHSLIII